MDLANAVASKKAIIFDLFFTLVSPDDDQSPPTWELLGIDKPSWRNQTFSSSSARLTGDQRDPYEIVRSMAHAVDASISASVIQDATDQRIARFARILNKVPESTLATLTALRNRGLRTALISNADTIETHAWESSPLSTLFDVTVFSWQVGAAKPDAKIYNHCLDLLELSAPQSMFVGDGGSEELSGARELGLTPVFARGLMPEMSAEEIRDRESCATYTIDSLEELICIGHSDGH